MNTQHDHLNELRQALRSVDPDTPLGDAVARFKQPFIVGDGKKWLYEGFVSMASSLRQALAAIDKSISPELPSFLLEPATYAAMLHVSVDEFNWSGPHTSNASIEEKVDNITALLLQQRQDSQSGVVAGFDEYVANQLGGKATPKWFKLNQWYHLPFEPCPQEFASGPLEGTRRQLSCWLRPGADDRELQRRARTGSIWVRRYSGDHWQAWFRHQGTYAYANANRLKQQANGTE